MIILKSQIPSATNVWLFMPAAVELNEHLPTDSTKNRNSGASLTSSCKFIILFYG